MSMLNRRSTMPTRFLSCCFLQCPTHRVSCQLPYATPYLHGLLAYCSLTVSSRVDFFCEGALWIVLASFHAIVQMAVNFPSERGD